MQFLTVALAALSAVLPAVQALAVTPVVDAHMLARSQSTAPKVVIYTDDYIGGETGLPTAAQLGGYNVLILAFLLAKGPADQVAQFQMLSSSERTALKKSYNDAGITLMCSSFGSTDTPTTDGLSATTLANNHAKVVKDLGLQGIDVDYEDMGAINKANGKAEQWLITYTQTLRNLLPAGQYFITHAPVAPWFSPIYTAGAYTKVNKEAGGDIDWYNVQFYNQGDTEYTTCEGLIHKSSNVFPKSSVLEINSVAGVPLSKIVIGKPALKYQADNGFVSFSTLASCIADAGEKGWAAGTMFWEYEKSMSTSLISGVGKALAAISGNNDIPVGPGGGASSSSVKTSTTSTKSAATSTSTGKHSVTLVTTTSVTTATITSTHHEEINPTTTHTSTATSAPSPPSNPSGGSCSSAPAWSSTKIYNGGSEVSGSGTSVSYDGFVWTNKWWTQGDKPGSLGDADPWAKGAACSGSKRGAVVSAFIGKRDVEVEERGTGKAAQHAGTPANPAVLEERIVIVGPNEAKAPKNFTRSKRSSHNARRQRAHLARLGNEMS